MGIHPTAIVGPDVELDPSVEVGPFAILEGQVRVGAGTRIMARAHLMGRTTLGRDNEVWPGTVLGSPPQHLGYRGADTALVIGDANVFREYTTVNRGFEEGGETVIGSRCYLMTQSHVAHDARLGDHVVVCNCALVAGHAEVGDRAFISGGVVIHQFVRVGRLAMFSGNTRVSLDVPPFMLAAERNEVWAVNSIGLQRAGVSREAQRELRALFKLLFRSSLPRPEAIRQAEARGLASPEVAEVLAFVKESKRGICRPKGHGHV